MAANSLPPALVEHPYVGQKHAILDRSAKIGQPPACVDRSDHHIIEDCRVVHLNGNVVHFPTLDRFEPLIPTHLERPGRASADQDEIGVHKRSQPIHVLAAKGVAPFALQPLDQLAVVPSHLVPLPQAPSGPGTHKADLGVVTQEDKIGPIANQSLILEDCLPKVIPVEPEK